MTSTTSDWLRQFRPAPDSEIRLVCFPYAGGAASYYFPLAKALAPGIDVHAVQYPGRQDRYREPVIDDIHRLADAVLPVVAELTDRPLALFGHSMGAVLAYEVALRLEERHGVKPLVLFASGRRAPSRYRDEDDVHLRDDTALLAEIRSLEGTSNAVLQDPELLEMVLPALRGDYRAIGTYRSVPGASVSCPVVGLIGVDDPKVSAEEARDWERHTRGGLDLLSYPGGHFFLTDRMTEVAEVIKDRLGALRGTA
ncbi:thioesterase [Streptomyces pactum]|uniref:Thioesterase n=1 Tax=Streptomyces pactum TaxID=68249 RepID=A0ABS0NP52_9ACTN|nr:alpha/beta fold hydrolase [Streptomyces pactum]MBH5336984.1 thioesterase [Streptomyces pactum]